MNTSAKTPTVFPLRLPFSTRTQLSTIAHSLGLSINEFITNAVAEKIEHVERVIAQQKSPGESIPPGKP